MIASTFPREATINAVVGDISPDSAATKATSELKGSMVAAKKAEIKRASSEMLKNLKRL